MIIRRATTADLEDLRELLREMDMGADHLPLHDLLVAVDDDRLAGAVHLQQVGDELYLRAMAVNPEFQCRGVGRALVVALLEGHDRVKVVARGPAAPFYKKLGFQPTGWQDIHTDMRAECDDCPDLETCAPQPLVFIRDEEVPVEK
jgi:N-acetylglutamate synthase-like GNAT family acetyltransferase